MISPYLQLAGPLPLCRSVEWKRSPPSWWICRSSRWHQFHELSQRSQADWKWRSSHSFPRKTGSFWKSQAALSGYGRNNQKIRIFYLNNSRICIYIYTYIYVELRKYIYCASFISCISCACICKYIYISRFDDSLLLPRVVLSNVWIWILYLRLIRKPKTPPDRVFIDKVSSSGERISEIFRCFADFFSCRRLSFFQVFFCVKL